MIKDYFLQMTREYLNLFMKIKKVTSQYLELKKYIKLII